MPDRVLDGCGVILMPGWPGRQSATVPRMPAAQVMQSTRPVTRSELVRDLQPMGVRPGGVLMVHTRMSAIGWVVGGAETVVRALLDVLGPAGTLMAYVGWNDSTGGLTGWPPEWQEAYRAECPPFDPEFSETDRQMGRVPERIRTWPGARVSGSHFRRMAAVGPAAGWLTEDQPWDHGFGPGSPLARLVQADGQVMLLGAPLDRLTILHHAESLVDSPEKRLARHAIPVRQGDEVIWRDVFDHDTSSAIGAFPYERAVGDQDPFAVIGQLALEAGCGVSGLVGKAETHLFNAGPLVRFGVEWLSREFGS
jgi:aminoglycoside 3-N-acetyltransferase